MRFYTTEEVPPTTRQVELIKKKKFAAVAFNPEYKAFVLHVAALSIDSGDEVYPSRRAQIAHLKVDEAPIEVFNKYADFTDIFLAKLVAELPEHMEINDYAIKLVDD